MKSRAFLIATALAVLTGSTAALAYPSADTLLTAGYDEQTDGGTLLYGISSIWQDGDDDNYDCRLAGEFEYELDDDGTTVTSLAGADGAEDDADTTFSGEDPETELDDVEYGDEGAEECLLSAVEFDEDVNHGKVVSGFVHSVKEMDLDALGIKGVGCLVRVIAQQDWGKELAESDDESLTVTLAAFETACVKGKKDRTDDDTESVSGNRGGGNGKPPWAGPDGDKSTKPGKGPKG